MYEHLHEIFWPSVHPGGGDDLGLGWFQIACLVVFNLVALPLLPFVPNACALDDHGLRLIRLDYRCSPLYPKRARLTTIDCD